MAPKLTLSHNGVVSRSEVPAKSPEEGPSIPEKERERRSHWQSRAPTINNSESRPTSKPPDPPGRRLLTNPKPPKNEEPSRALYETSFPGWVTSTLPRHLQARHLLQEALIPSPLISHSLTTKWVRLADARKTAWTRVIASASIGIRTLYNYIRENESEVDELMFARELLSNCSRGFICSLNDHDTPVKLGHSINSRPESDAESLPEFRRKWIEGDHVVPL